MNIDLDDLIPANTAARREWERFYLAAHRRAMEMGLTSAMAKDYARGEVARAMAAWPAPEQTMRAA